jgi:hypothetical protein
MITFAKKTEPQIAPAGTEDNRFDQIRKAAKERHRKSDTDGTRRRADQTAEDNRLI